MTEFFWGCVGIALIIFAVLAGFSLMIRAANRRYDE